MTGSGAVFAGGRGWSGWMMAGWVGLGVLGGLAIMALAARRGGARSGSGGVGWLRVVSGLLGAVVVIAASAGLHDPLGSMTEYTAALMVLGQVAPPFILLAVAAGSRVGAGGVAASGSGEIARGLLGAFGRGVRVWLRDPGVALVCFAGLAIATGLPSVLDRSLANALFSAPLGLLNLAAGLLFWAQIMPGTRVMSRDVVAGVFTFIGSLPMTLIATIWMSAPHVLYAPYLDVICRWDLTPLEDQHWSGFVMLVSGLPLQVAAAWLLVGGPKMMAEAR